MGELLRQYLVCCADQLRYLREGKCYHRSAGRPNPLSHPRTVVEIQQRIRNVCGDLGLVLRGRLCLAVDNTAAIAICENPGVTARNKHFSDAVHYVRHEYDHGRIRLVFVTTDKQRADGFTKPLESAAFHKWRRHIISAHPPV